jgi:hypothetical protein
MTANPYQRDSLTATRRKRLDVDGLLGLWVGAVADLLEDCSLKGEHHRAYGLLAGWNRLRRVRPELLARQDSIQTLEQADRKVAADGPKLVAPALQVPYLPTWIEEAEHLDHSYEELADPTWRTELACELIRDFDDAELVYQAATRFGIEDRELDLRLSDARAWLSANANAFLAASIHIQTIAMTLRPDLVEFNPGLAKTARKFLWLLDALEDAEADLEFAGQPPLPPGEVKGLWEAYRSESLPQPASQSTWLPSKRTVAKAAATRDAEVGGQSYCWKSPDGRYVARLTIPPDLPGADQDALCIEFMHSDRSLSSATDMAERAAFLEGIEASIDKAGRARFLLGDLRCKPESAEPRLEVGDPRNLWELQHPRTGNKGLRST